VQIIAICGAGLGALLFSGCSKKEEPASEGPPPPLYPTFTYQVGIYSPQGTDEPPFDLLLGGKTVGTNGTTTPYVKVDVDSTKPLWDPKLGLTAKLDTPCGRIEVPLTRRYEAPADQQKITGNGRENTFETLEAVGTAHAQIWVDNVGGKATTLEVGQQKIDLPADDAWVGFVRTGPCPNAGIVKLGGIQVGKLGPAEDIVVYMDGQVRLPGTRATLIDARGGRCYRQREVVYADRPATMDRAPDRTFRGARVYAIAPVTDFLESAPHKLTISVVDDGSDVGHARSRSELDRCK
jgi:hypothetical protein